jgi:hypothetical protein
LPAHILVEKVDRLEISHTHFLNLKYKNIATPTNTDATMVK